MIEKSESGKDQKVKDFVQETMIIEQVTTMLDKYQQMVKNCFKNDALFERQRRTAFENFINREIGRHSMAEMLATFTDKVLRKGGLRLNESE